MKIGIDAWRLMRLFRPFLLLLSVLTVCADSAWSDAAPSTNKLRVGVIAPLSGPAASWGNNLRNGVLMGHAALSPDVASHLEFLFEDDQMKAANSAAAFHKLADSGISALIIFSSPAAGAVVPLAEHDKIPTFVLTAATTFTDGREYAMQHFITSAEQCRVLVPELTRRKFHKVAIVATVHESMSDAIGRCKTMAAKDSVEFAAAKEFQPGETDFRAAITALKQERPDAVLVGLFSPSLATFLRQLRESGSALPVFGFANFESGAEMKAAGAAAEGAFFSAAYLTKEFTERYESKFGGYPELTSGNGYDAVGLIGGALSAGAKNAAEINAYLHSVKKFTGSMGSYGAARNSFSVPAGLKTVHDGKFEQLSR